MKRFIFYIKLQKHSKPFILLIVGIFCLSCQSFPLEREGVKPPTVTTHKPPEFPIKNYNVSPGRMTLIQFPMVLKMNSSSQYEMHCDKKNIPFFINSKNIVTAYVSEDYYSTREKYQCFILEQTNHFSTSPKEYLVARVNVIPYSYPKETLNVAKSKIFLSDADQKRVEAEKKERENLYQNSHPSPLFSRPFHLPMDSFITSHYGTTRVFNNSKHTSHLGTDFRAKSGTKIFSTNSGVVVFTGNTFYGGNTVVIDHGIGIFTSYAHLSKIYINVGESVADRTLLGDSGMTGRVNGPHLHWGVTVHQNHIDGQSLIESSHLDFNSEAIPSLFSTKLLPVLF